MDDDFFGDGGDGDVKEVIEDEAVKEGEGDAQGENVEGEHAEGEPADGENVEGEHAEGEHVEGEYVDGEHAEGEHVEGDHVTGEHVEGEGAEKVLGEGEELLGEGLEGEFGGEEKSAPDEAKTEEYVEEEAMFEEEPPPDPAAPFNFSDSNEAIKPFYALRQDQLAEVEQLWDYFQDYTPAYTDIKDYITEKELIYMLKSLNLMTYTPEQLQELIEYCVRPPHPQGHITFDQFVKMVTLRQRDFPIEEELRAALQVFDPEKTNEINRDAFKEVLATQGYKMPQKQLDNLIKEVDMSNDGTIGIDDVIGTMCIDLMTDDLVMLRNAVFPPEGGVVPPQEDDF